jgi:hypothetical protein
MNVNILSLTVPERLKVASIKVATCRIVLFGDDLQMRWCSNAFLPPLLK